MSDEKKTKYVKDPKILMSFGAGALTSGLGFHFFKKEKNDLKEKNDPLQKLQEENKSLKESLKNDNQNEQKSITSLKKILSELNKITF